MLLHVPEPLPVVLPSGVSAAVVVVRDDRVSVVADKGSTWPGPDGLVHIDNTYRKLRVTRSGIAVAAIGTATFNSSSGVVDLVEAVCGAVDSERDPGVASVTALDVLSDAFRTASLTEVPSVNHPTLGSNTVTAFAIAGVGRTRRPVVWLAVLRRVGIAEVFSGRDIVVLAPPEAHEGLERAAREIRQGVAVGQEEALARAIRGQAPKTIRTAPINPDCHSVTIFSDGRIEVGDHRPPELTVPRH